MDARQIFLLSASQKGCIDRAGSSGKSILDIQREESFQAKRRAAQEAAQEAERAAAAASAPSHSASSWGKTVLRPSAPAGSPVQKKSL